MKNLSALIFLIACVFQSAAATLPNLTETTDPGAGSIMWVVDPNLSDPKDRKITIPNLRTEMGLSTAAAAETLWSVGFIVSGDAFTGDVTATLESDGSTALVIADSVTVSGWVLQGTTTFGTTSSTVDFGTAGVRITTDGDGAMTWLGQGDGSDENLTWNLDDTSNVVAVSSSTGVTDIDLGTIDLMTDTLDLTGTGTLNGLDAIDATGEATLEAALDIAGEVVSTGMASTVIADGVTVSGWTLQGTTTIGTLAGAVDGGSATSFEVPNGANPTTDAFGEIAADNDAWAASRGALEHFDGTASTFVVATLASDTPSNGQVPTWNTGGTITWESPGAGSQTPWTQDINAAEFSLTNVTSIVGTGSGETVIENSAGVIFTNDTHVSIDGTLDATLLTGPTLTLTGTGTLNGLDAIDGTGETTLEAALDIGGEVVSTGMGSTVIADSVTVATWTMTGAPGLSLNNGTTGPGSLRIVEDGDNGSNYGAFTVPSALGGDRTYTFPDSNTTIPIASQIITFAGPSTARTITFPDANVTVARTDAANTFTGVQTMTSPAITTAALAGAQQLAEGASIALDAVSSATGAYSGMTRAGTAGATLIVGDLIYLDPDDSRWELADANAASAANGDARGILGICVLAAAADGDPTVVLLQGIVRADAAFPSFTINSPLYVSETAGDITGTSPTTEDNVVRVVGYATTADEIYFAPAGSWVVYDAP